MKQGNIQNWSSIDTCKNLLFFVELVNELLFDYSIPSNRISTLNSHYLCIDALNAIKSIDDAGVPEGNLKPIVEELYSSLSKDALFIRRNEHPLNYFVKYNSKSQSFQLNSRAADLSYEEGKTIVHTINQRYFKNDWYYDTLKEEIINIVIGNQESDWIDLFRLTKEFLTEVVNKGYDPRYIWIHLNRIFFSERAIESPSAISEYMSIFSFSQENYNVIAKAPDSFQKLPHSRNIEIKNEQKCRTKSKREKEFLKKRENECFILFTRKALDPFSAVDFCKSYLEINSSLYRMYDHDSNIKIKDVQWATYDKTNWFTYVKNERNLVKKVKMPGKEKLMQNMINSLLAIENAIEQSNVKDIIALNNALRFHSLSLDSESMQNQLLDLWAIFETLLNISNKHTGDRIQQVCISLVPILKRKYLYSLFSQLVFDIKNYSEEWFSKIVGDSTSDDSIILKVCTFILLDDRKTEYDDFLKKCDDFPLLKERVSYYKTVLSTPQKVYSFVDKHSERVRWQIMRIYRNRNLIVHNAKTTPYLNLLIENLHSYVDDFLEYTVHYLANGYTLESMRQELFSHECEWMEQFQRSKEKTLSEKIIRKMLFDQ